MANDNEKDFIAGMVAAAQNPITNLDEFSEEEMIEKIGILIQIAKDRKEKERKVKSESDR